MKNLRNWLTTSEISKIFKVNVSTIKRWIDKGFFRVSVTSGGHRRVDPKDFKAFIAKYPKLAGNSYVIKKIIKGKELNKKALNWQNYYIYLYSNSSLNVQNKLEEMFLMNVSVVDILQNVVAPTLVHIGKLWQKGKISIYDEHRMTFLLRMDLLGLEKLISGRIGFGSPTAVLGCVAGDNHEIPLLMLHLLLKQQGYRTVILGINNPASEIIHASRKEYASLICLTQTFSKIRLDSYFDKVYKYAKSSKVWLASGGAGWPITLRKSKKGYRYFDSLSEFNKFSKKLGKPV